MAFLDIRMPGMSGVEMASRIREISPRTNIIFVSAYAEYALEALQLHTSGYLLKPVTAEKVQMELENLRFPQEEHPEENNMLRIQCLGNFEVFVNDKPLVFGYRKTKELLAYLIDRKGAACNTEELCAVLWENQQDSVQMRSYLRKLMVDLTHTLETVGAKDIFLKNRNSFAIDIQKVDCDYYRLLDKIDGTEKKWTGEYMSQYSWGEKTLSVLSKLQ